VWGKFVVDKNPKWPQNGGKKKLLQKVISDTEARQLLGRVGESLELRDEVRANMKAFVLSKVYSENAGVTCGQARASRRHKMKKKKSTIRLPPDNDTLDQRLERTNYITYCQIHYNLLEHPSPIGHGWELMNGKCRPVRHTQPPLPHQLTPRDCTDDSIDDSSSDGDSDISESTDNDE